MKKLEKEQLEETIGGGNYCDLINYWIESGGDGYQGAAEDLIYAGLLC